MAASVTVHHKAFSDPRIAYLAELGGFDRPSAIGRMAMLWSACTELRTDCPPIEMIRSCIGRQGDQWLLECGLGERMPDGSIRVRGKKDDQGDDRLDWFGEIQDRRVAGGKARAAAAPRDAKGRMQSRSVQHIQQDSSSNHLSESDQDPDPENTLSGSPVSPELPDQGPRGDRDQDPGPQLELVADPPPQPVDLAIAKPGPTRVLERSDLRRRLFLEAWQFAAMQHHELKAEGISPEARNCWSGLPAMNSFEAQALYARIDEHLICDPPNVDHVREVLRNRILVASAEARFKLNHLNFLTPARLWDPKSFSIAKDMTPKQVEEDAKARASPRGPREPEPLRRMPFLSKP